MFICSPAHGTIITMQDYSNSYYSLKIRHIVTRQAVPYEVPDSYEILREMIYIKNRFCTMNSNTANNHTRY